MTKKEKIELVKELTTKLQEKPNIYVADAGGLSVAQVNELRRLCHDRGIDMQVVKNTLLKKALDNVEGDYSEIYDSLKLQSSVFFVDEALNAPAKIMREFRKSNEKPMLKVAWLDSAVFVGDGQLKALSELKSKEELIGEIIGLLQSPIKTVLGQLQSGGNKIAGLVKALQEREA